MGGCSINNNYVTLVTVMLVNMYIYIFMQFLCSAYMHISGDNQSLMSVVKAKMGAENLLIDSVNY